MKLLPILFFIALSFSTYAQKAELNLSGSIFNSPTDTLFISQVFGQEKYQNYDTVIMDSKGNFNAHIILPKPDYYLVQIGSSDIHLVVRGSNEIKIYGDGRKLGEFCNILGSEESNAMNKFDKVVKKWQAKNDSSMRVISENKEKGKEINDYMGKEYYKFQNQLKSFVGINQNSAALVMALGSVNMEEETDSYESIIKQIYKSFPESFTVNEYMNKFIDY